MGTAPVTATASEPLPPATSVRFDGWVEMTLLPGCLERLSRWLLLFAGQVRVVAPLALRQQVRALARAAVDFFCEPAEVC